MPPYPIAPPCSASFLCLNAFTVKWYYISAVQESDVTSVTHLAIFGTLVCNKSDDNESDDGYSCENTETDGKD